MHNLTRDLLDDLRLRIISFQFAPGEKINEAHISRQLGISRGPVREALRILEKEGLIVYVPRKGTSISHTSLEDYEEIIGAREMIECYAIDILREKKIKDLSGVKATLDKVRDMPVPTSHSTPEEKFAYIKANVLFHINLVEATGNSLLIQYYSTVFNKFAKYEFGYTEDFRLTTIQIKEHRQILEAILDGKYNQAKQYLSKHIRSRAKTIGAKIRSNRGS